MRCRIVNYNPHSPDLTATGDAMPAPAPILAADKEKNGFHRNGEVPSAIDASELLRVLAAVRNGDFSVRMPLDRTGLAGKVADNLNAIIELNHGMAEEFDRISKVVGKEGKIHQRARLEDGKGGWGRAVESVNALI